MTRQRSISATVLLGTGLVLALAIGHYRFGGPVLRAGLQSPARGTAPAAVSSARDLGHTATPDATSPAATSAEAFAFTPFLQDLGASMKSIQAETDSSLKDEKLERLANGIALVDLPSAAAFLHQQNSSELGRDLGRLVLRRWTENNPRAAADWVSTWPAGSPRQEAVHDVAVVWAGQTLSGAAEWARQLPDDLERQDGLSAVAYEAAQTEPLEALRLALELPESQVRIDLIAHTVRQWATRDSQAAVAEWAGQLPEPESDLRARVLADVAIAWAESDPVGAATLAIHSVPAGKPQADALVGIVQRWVQNEPEKAATWVEAFPEGPLRDASLEELVKLWADRNPEQPGNWLNGLSPGPARDVAVGAYVGKIAIQSPEAAAGWAEVIEDQKLRSLKLESVGESWLVHDPAAARAWILQADLPESAKARLLASAPTHSP